MADFVYNATKLKLANGTLDLVAIAAANKLKIALLEAASDEDPLDDTMTAVFARGGTTELATYTRGVLAGEVASQDDSNDLAQLDFTVNQVFSAVIAQNAIVAYVLYDATGGDVEGTNIPIMFVDETTGLPITPNGSDITITWNASGILQLT